MSIQMSKYSNKMLLITAFTQGASNLSELRAKTSKISVCIHMEVEWQVSLLSTLLHYGKVRLAHLPCVNESCTTAQR